MGRFTTETCHMCGEIEFRDNMLEYNDHYFCGINCKLAKEREDDKNLTYRNNVVRLNTR